MYRFLGMLLTSLVAAQCNIHTGPNLPGQVNSRFSMRNSRDLREKRDLRDERLFWVLSSEFSGLQPSDFSLQTSPKRAKRTF